MNDTKSKIKKVILFREGLVGIGGAERLLLEEAKYLEKRGIVPYILVFDFREAALFNKMYNFNVEQIGHRIESKNLLLKINKWIFNMYCLRKKIREIKPDAIISTDAWECVQLYLATLFTSFSYMSHIHGTIFWFPNDLLKYAFIHKKVFNEIMDSVIGHKEFISTKTPKSTLIRRITKEVFAVAVYLGVRKAKKIFVLSNQMRWEVKKLYGKDATVLKGAFTLAILNYKQKVNIKERLGLTDKRIILNVNRLDSRKRVDLLIKSFNLIYDRFDDVVLVIGGVGPEEENLKALAKDLDLEDRVKFVGYIKEEELWDYLASCDVFAHPNWADFAIAAYEPLALQKKVIWSSEMEIDKNLSTNKHIFVADPTINDFAKAIEKALTTEVKEENDLSIYSWDQYCEGIMKELED